MGVALALPGFGKATATGALSALLQARAIELQVEAPLDWGLHLYRQGAADFADCLRAGIGASADRAPLLTFDP